MMAVELVAGVVELVALVAGAAKEGPVGDKEEAAAVPAKVAKGAVGGGREVCADGARADNACADYVGGENVCGDYVCEKQGYVCGCLSSGCEMIVAPPHI